MSEISKLSKSRPGILLKKEKSFGTNIIDYLVKAENFSVITFFILLTITSFLQVLFRYVIKISAPWTEELSRYFMIWMIFIGAGWVTHAENHITINVIELVIKNKKLLKFIDVITAIVLTVFSIVYLYSALTYIPQIIRSNEHTIATKMPMWIPQFCLIIGGVLIMIHCFEVLIKKILLLLRGGE